MKLSQKLLDAETRNKELLARCEQLEARNTFLSQLCLLSKNSLPPQSISSFSSAEIMAKLEERSGEEILSKKPRMSRSPFPKWATDIFENWLKGNLHYPYPSPIQKDVFCLQTNLTLKQINDWFINVRRRRGLSIKNQKHK